MISMLAIFLIIGHISTVIKAANCGVNEQQLKCAPPMSCQPSCSRLNGGICPRIRMCIFNGCICEDGYVRDDRNNNTCIQPQDCVIPLAKETGEPNDECGPNEVYNSCPSLLSCQATCDQPAAEVCPSVCETYSCECKVGYVRTSTDDRTCIKQTECPKNSTNECGENEEYNRFASRCQPSCEEPDRKPCPLFRYPKGCACKQGFYRATNSVTSPCVQCPITLDSY